MRSCKISKRYKCPCCGNIFYIPYQSRGGGRTYWVYNLRIGNRKIYMCSYHCHKQAEKLDNEERMCLL